MKISVNTCFCLKLATKVQTFYGRHVIENNHIFIIIAFRRLSYSVPCCFFRRLVGLSPRLALQKRLNCWGEEKLNSSIISLKGI